MTFDSERLNKPYAHKVETLLSGFLVHEEGVAPKVTLQEWSSYAEGLGNLANPSPEQKAKLLVDSLEDDTLTFDRIGGMVLGYLRQSNPEEMDKFNPLHKDLLRCLSEGEGLRYLVDLAAGRTQVALASTLNDLQRDAAYFGTFNDTAIEAAKSRKRHLMLFQTNLRHRATTINPMKESR